MYLFLTVRIVTAVGRQHDPMSGESPATPTAGPPSRARRPRGVALDADDLAAQLAVLETELDRAQGAPLSGAAAALLQAHSDSVFGSPRGAASSSIGAKSVEPTAISLTDDGERKAAAGAGEKGDGGGTLPRKLSGLSAGSASAFRSPRRRPSGGSEATEAQSREQPAGRPTSKASPTAAMASLRPGEVRFRFATHFSAHFTPRQLRRALQLSTSVPGQATPRRTLQAAGVDLTSLSNVEVSASCHDPRFAPHGCLAASGGRWLTTGMFPQHVCVLLGRLATVRAVSMTLRAVKRVTVLVRVPGCLQPVPLAHADMRLPERSAVEEESQRASLAAMRALVVLPSGVTAEAVELRIDACGDDFAVVEEVVVRGAVSDGDGAADSSDAVTASEQRQKSDAALDLRGLATALGDGTADAYIVYVQQRRQQQATSSPRRRGEQAGGSGGSGGGRSPLRRSNSSSRRLGRRGSRLRIN